LKEWKRLWPDNGQPFNWYAAKNELFLGQILILSPEIAVSAV